VGLCVSALRAPVGLHGQGISITQNVALFFSLLPMKGDCPGNSPLPGHLRPLFLAIGIQPALDLIYHQSLHTAQRLPHALSVSSKTALCKTGKVLTNELGHMDYHT